MYIDHGDKKIKLKTVLFSASAIQSIVHCDGSVEKKIIQNQYCQAKNVDKVNLSTN